MCLASLIQINTLELCSNYSWGLTWLENFLAFIVYADL